MPRPKRDMQRVNTYLKKSHYDVAKKLAKIDGNTAADQIRLALNFYITDRIQKLHEIRDAQRAAAPTPLAEALHDDAVDRASKAVKH